MPLSIPVLGEIELEPAPDGYWTFQLDHRGHAVDLDFNIEGNMLTQGAVDTVAKFLANLEAYDGLAKNAIRDDYQRGDEYAVRLYVSHHLEQLGVEGLARCFGIDDPKTVDPETFLSKLHLHRLGLYPDDEDQLAILDYTIDGSLTDYVIAVGFDSQGKVGSVEMEC